VTDENDRPVPDVAVIFSLGDPCLGTIGVGAGAGQTSRERTDSQGIATAPWTVGAARCVGAIAVSIEGTRVSFTYNVDVKQNTFWNARNSLLVAAAAAGAGAAIIIADPFEDSSEPIRPVPPPVVRP
jgi:hypothetical protein